MSKVIVFGGNGFIGGNLVKRLAEETADEIVVFDRFSGYTVGSGHPFEALGNVRIMPGNFFNRADLDEALNGADYVFHLVSSTTPATAGADPFIDIDTNLRSSVELFELCVQHGVKKVIFPSSGGTVYGDIDSEAISEDAVPVPRSPYGIGKLTIEHYLRYFKHAHGLDYIVYRIANPYGPGQNIYGKQGVVPIFMYKFLKKEPVTVYGDGSMVRDYLYIDDLIEMLVRSYRHGNQHNEYNVGSGRGVTINQLLDAIKACAGFEVEVRHVDAPPTYVQRSVLNIKRFVNEFGLQPATSLEEGIARTWEYVKRLG